MIKEQPKKMSIPEMKEYVQLYGYEELLSIIGVFAVVTWFGDDDLRLFLDRYESNDVVYEETDFMDRFLPLLH